MFIEGRYVQFPRSSFESRLSQCVGDLSGRSAMYVAIIAPAGMWGQVLCLPKILITLPYSSLS